MIRTIDVREISKKYQRNVVLKQTTICTKRYGTQQ